MQIADYICEHILSEKLRAGDRVQSVREMATTVAVNPNTVVRTFNYLEDEGIIFKERGVGYFVGTDAYLKTRNMKKDSFTKEFLPEVFKMMDLLQIDWEELEQLYQNRPISKEAGAKN